MHNGIFSYIYIYIYKDWKAKNKKIKRRKGKRGEKIKYVWLIRTDKMTYYVFHRLTLTRKFTKLIQFSLSGK